MLPATWDDSWGKSNVDTGAIQLNKVEPEVVCERKDKVN